MPHALASRPQPATPPSSIDVLWRAFKATGSRDARERLIVHYAPVVKYVASRTRVKLPQHIEHSEIVSYGIFGLIDAIEKFDPSRGVSFEAYAARRIRGAIVDELRKVDWVPRSVRAKASAVDRACTALRHELGRDPETAELAGEMGLSESDMHRVRSQIASTHVLALDQPVAIADGDSPGTLADLLADGTGDPAAVSAAEDLEQLVVDAISRTPHRDRFVLTMSFFEGLTMAEIGHVLGVSESRICQIRARALREIRELIQLHWRDERDRATGTLACNVGTAA